MGRPTELVKALVIGYGSIGKRHARVLTGLGCETAVLSRRSVDYPLAYNELGSALSRHGPDYVVIANPTSCHYETLAELAATGFSAGVLVEKPLFDQYREIPVSNFRSLCVAYNLRFHPVLRRLREILDGETVLSVLAYVGQYLPDWRPDFDYRRSYSASAAMGGGALRDLSHELDYLCWIFGPWRSVTALGGHLSSLEIDSDDIFVLLMQADRCPIVTVQVSYLDRVARRRIVVNTQEHTIEADLVGGTISIDGEIRTINLEQDHSYREMHRAALCEDFESLCTVQEGLATMELIEAAERAGKTLEWIIR